MVHPLPTDPFRPFGIDALNVHYTLTDIKGGPNPPLILPIQSFT